VLHAVHSAGGLPSGDTKKLQTGWQEGGENPVDDVGLLVRSLLGYLAAGGGRDVFAGVGVTADATSRLPATL
jgi:hypothetical protein